MADPGNNGDDAAGSANVPRPIFMRDVDEELLNEKKTGFISTVRLVDLDIEPKALTGLAVRETIAEFFPPAELFFTRPSSIACYIQRAERLVECQWGQSSTTLFKEDYDDACSQFVY